MHGILTSSTKTRYHCDFKIRVVSFVSIKKFSRGALISYATECRSSTQENFRGRSPFHVSRVAACEQTNCGQEFNRESTEKNIYIKTQQVPKLTACAKISHPSCTVGPQEEEEEKQQLLYSSSNSNSLIASLQPAACCTI